MHPLFHPTIQDQTRPANLAFQPAAKFEPVMNEVYSKLQAGCVMCDVCVCVMCNVCDV